MEHRPQQLHNAEPDRPSDTGSAAFKTSGAHCGEGPEAEPSRRDDRGTAEEREIAHGDSVKAVHAGAHVDIRSRRDGCEAQRVQDGRGGLPA